MVEPGRHNRRVHWGEGGFRFWRDYVDDANPYLSVPAKPIDGRWPFNDLGFPMSAIFNLAVSGSGGGDPALARYPSAMLIDWIRVW